MTITNTQTGRPMKHFAQDESTKERYVVLSLQNDTNPDECSVVNYDALDANLRAELLSAVQSDEFQKVPEIWKLLDKKFFYDYPKQTMLKVLSGLRQIKVVPQNRVRIEMPNDVTMTPKEIIDAINTYEAEKNGKGVKFNASTVNGTVASPQVSEQQSEKITEVESKVNSLETKLDNLTATLTELVNAFRAATPKGE